MATLLRSQLMPWAMMLTRHKVRCCRAMMGHATDHAGQIRLVPRMLWSPVQLCGTCCMSMILRITCSICKRSKRL